MMTPSFWGFLVLGLLALMLLMLGLASLWNTHDAAQARLPEPGAPATLPMTRAADSGWPGWRSPTLAKWLAGWPRLQDYAHFLQQTGWPLGVDQVLVASVTLLALTALIALLLGAGTGLALMAALLAALMPQGVLALQRQRRSRQLEEQLPDALSLLARSMQAGHAFTSALQLAVRECPRPMGSELASVFGAIQYGATVQEALSQWAQRVAGDDVRLFVTGVRIQTETGGNLAELMHQSAALIRERQKLRGNIRVLSAEGRISALILTLLPFVLAGLLTALNPQFMARLWHDPQGHRLVGAALLLMLLGIAWMWRMVQIRP